MAVSSIGTYNNVYESVSAMQKRMQRLPDRKGQAMFTEPPES